MKYISRVTVWKTVMLLITCALAGFLLVSCAPEKSEVPESRDSAMSASDISESSEASSSSSASASSSSASSSSSSSAASKVEVPNVVSMTSEEAQKTIAAAGLRIGVVERKPSNTVANGAVISQNPVAKTVVDKGSTVSLTISSGKTGPEKVEVPNVVSLHLDDAEKTLNNAGLKVGSTEHKSSDSVVKGAVISQDPTAQTAVDKGSSVSLVVSSGKAEPATVEVPNVVSLHLDDAKKAIEKAGLKVGSTDQEPSDSVVKGAVISQDPVANTSVDKGSSVSLVVSSGKAEPAQVEVPNVESLSLDDAKKAIKAAGLKVGSTDQKPSDSVAKGAVISQNPVANTSVDKGSSVSLVVSSGKAEPATVEVPDTIGMKTAAAEQAFKKSGLIGTCDGEIESRDFEPGCVVKQSIAPGTSVEKGSEVSFTVAKAPTKVSVPSIEGKQVDKATSLLQRAGLELQTTEEYNHEVEEGCIISQDPLAGTEVEPGTVVNAVVSLGPEPGKLVVVPDVTNLTWPDAKDALTQAGLNAEMTGDPTGLVESQDVAAGTEVDEGTVVTVNLVKPVVMVDVPDVMNLSWDDAKAALLAADLVPAKEGDSDGNVVAQDIAAGTSVEEGTTVTVTLEQPVVMTTVPDVVDLSWKDAKKKIEDAGLEAEKAGDDTGTVVKQKPEKDESVAQGSTVTVTLDESVKIVEVPDLVGKTVDEAAAALEKADLVLDPKTPDEGVIVDQDPDKGTKVHNKTTITVTVEEPND